MTAVYVLAEDKSKGEKITKSDLILSLEKNFLTGKHLKKYPAWKNLKEV